MYIGVGKMWRESSYICFAKQNMAGVLPLAEGTWLLLRGIFFHSWERLVRSKGDEEYGRGKGSNPFSRVKNCSVGFLSKVNHSPKAFAKLALGWSPRKSWPVVTLWSTLQPETPPQRWLYPFCIPPATPGCRPKGAVRACAGTLPWFH